ELGLAIRARDRSAAPAPVDDFHGVITERTVPVRWGSVQARVYRPHSSEVRLPAMAFFHGGGFIGGDLDSHDGLCRELAAASQALVLSVAYRLAPEAPFPAGLE